MGTSAGSIYIDLIIKNKLKAQTEKAAQQTANTVQKTMQKAGGNAGAAFRQTMQAAMERMQKRTAQTMAKAQQAMQSSMQKAAQSTTQSAKTMGQGFNKSLALAQQKVEQLEAEFQSLGVQLDALTQKQAAALNAPKPNATKSLYQQLVKQQEAVYRRLIAAEQRLTVERQAEQVKQTATAQSQAQKSANTQIMQCQKVQAVSKAVFDKMRISVSSAFSGIASVSKKALSGIASGVKKAASGFSKIKALTSKFSLGMKKSTSGVQSFGARLRSIVGGALIFNGISRALTGTITYFKNAVMASGQFRDALANLKGAASTAAAPIVQVLTPALTALANAAATVFSYVAKLFSLLTGKSVASMKASAAATNQYAKSVNGATDAAKELAEANNTLGIDELNVVQQDSKQDGSGGSSSGTVAPDYEFDGQSNLLDKMLESIKKGDWYQVGALISQKLNETMAAINWPSIEKTARQWVDNAVNVLNGLVQNLNWPVVGDTFANGLNVALHCYDDFFQKFDWTGLGRGIGTGLNQMVATLDWQAVGRFLTDKIKALFELLHGFVTTFDFASLGSSLAVAIMAAVNNIDWVQFAMDLNNLAFGLLEGLQNLIRGIDWASMGATVREMLASIDWAGIVSSLAYSLGQLAGGIWIFLQEALADIGQKLGSYFTDIGENGIQGLLQGMWNLLCDIGTWLYDNLVKPMVEGVKEMLGIHSPSRVFAEIGQFLIEGLFGGLLEKWHLISGFFTEKFDWAKDKVTTTWKNVQSNTLEMWGSISSSLKNTLSNLGERFGDTWTKLQSSTKGSWSSMTSTIKGAVNVIISFMNQLLSGAGNMINGLIDLLNKFSIDVPADVPIIGGTKFGFSMDHITVPNIPMLANGGVITQPTLAMMGEYAGASTNPEIVAPESKIRGLLDESMAAMGENINRLVRLLEYHSSKTSTVNQPIEVKLDGQVLYRAMAQVEERQGVKIGGAFAYSY